MLTRLDSSGCAIAEDEPQTDTVQKNLTSNALVTKCHLQPSKILGWERML
jgi:hypothetical protein